MLTALPALVPAVFTGSGSYEVAAPQRGGTTRTNPPEFVPPEFDPNVARHFPGSAIFDYFRRARPSQFTRWSDVQPVSQFAQTAFYHEAYRSLGVRDLSTMLSLGGSNRIEFVGIGLDN